MKILLMLYLCVLFLPLVFASTPTKFQMKNGSVSFVVPEKWENAKELFGIQLMFLGPMLSENRPVITVESTDFAGMKFDSSSLTKNEKEYEEGRVQWIKKYDGRALEFFNYQTKNITPKITDHSIGFRYAIGANEFIERSHFITCEKNLYHIKIFLLANEESTYKAAFEQMMKSFSCQ